jgi:hypothetical protein
MKKSLVLAMAMALGVTASAYAANPFSDVPAGHWAYDSISKLAAAGVIEGYGDDTFRGDRLMTRYEMAQIVAKAMAKGANVDKLAAEFADELDALGVRVAALEKKSDNVKITGHFRYSYSSYKDTTAAGVSTHSHRQYIRSRLTFNGKVNDNWNYVGLIENQHDIGFGNAVDVVGEEGTNFQRAYVQGRLGGLKVQAGRINKSRLDNGDLHGSRMDAIDLTYGDKVKLNAYVGKPTNMKSLFSSTAKTAPDKDGKTSAVSAKGNWAYGINASADLGKNFNLFVGYDEFKAKNVAVSGGEDSDYGKAINGVADGKKDGIFDVGFNYKFGGGVSLGATYLHTKYDVEDGATKDAKHNGFLVNLAYKGAQAAKPGSWGLTARYYQTPAGFFVAPGWEDGHSATAAMAKQGAKGFWVRANYAVAKNIVADIEYWDLKGRVTDIKSKTLWTALNFYF